VIVVAGSPAEAPVVRLVEEAAALDIETIVLEEERAGDWNLDVEAGSDGIRARAVSAGREVDLLSATGLYLRLTAPRLAGPPADPLRHARHTAALTLISGLADVASMRVANRPSAMSSNTSKPYQAALVRACGWSVPDTLVSNDPVAVRAFLDHHGRVVYKSTSGIRSIVDELTVDRLADLEKVRRLPTQFQQLLVGTNVRVHVIGDEVHAVEVESPTIDYRYSAGASMRPTTLTDRVRDACLRLSRELGLPLAGIDLLRDQDGRWWCFEVNPSPAYSCFEEPTGLPMARSLASWLAGIDAA
jgi:glutathione synthase/RimK-type ligase-like ATP-grasp enzyme